VWTCLSDSAAARFARHTLAAFAILIATSLVIGLAFMHPPRPELDALRYIDYAINVHDHGVFSLQRDMRAGPPTPESTHTPLYPAWIALFMRIDPDIRSSLGCIRSGDRDASSCRLDLDLLRAAQLILAGIFLGASWLLAYRLSGSIAVAWLTAGFALLSREPLRYANQVLTEALLQPALALFAVFLVYAYQEKRARWMLGAGVMLGLAALTRPAYAYLFFGVAGTLAVAAMAARRKGLLIALAAFTVAYGIVVAPWLLRNKQLFDRYALTSSYAGDILSQRVAYNRMGWAEFGIAWLYWFPDFGDNLAYMIFPPDLCRKLGWDTGSYYADVAPALYDAAEEEAGDPDAVLPLLIRTEVLGNPVKHTLVSLALAWRGLFVASYWGLVGLACFIAVLIRQTRRRDHALLVASLPVWFMVGFHAFVSVSIPRYNLALIPLYAFALAWTAHTAFRAALPRCAIAHGFRKNRG
jgi:4-amino-4-deoxy-L-arabinose transferase-like glycosyltransferase